MATCSKQLTLFFAWTLLKISQRVAKERANADKWRKENPDAATDPNWKLQKTYRDQIYHALKGRRKSARGQELLGCSFEFFRTHIENQFVPGMAWVNHGTVWELDHILPCAEFHLQHSEEQEVCFHWTNFQPLFVGDNRAKGDKVL